MMAMVMVAVVAIWGRVAGLLWLLLRLRVALHRLGRPFVSSLVSLVLLECCRRWSKLGHPGACCRRAGQSQLTATGSLAAAFVSAAASFVDDEQYEDDE